MNKKAVIVLAGMVLVLVGWTRGAPLPNRDRALEYRVVYVRGILNNSEEDSDKRADLMTEDFNKLAEGGWEYVGPVVKARQWDHFSLWKRTKR